MPEYRVQIQGGRWLPPVSGNNINDSNDGYAGNGQPIIGLAISGGFEYRVQVVGGRWLPPVTGYDVEESQNGYAGNGQVIINVAINSGKPYCVKTGGRWLPYVAGYNIADSQNGYAGIGQPITDVAVSANIGIERIEQVKWCNNGTGIQGISTQRELGWAEGCFFMCCCVKAGLFTNQQIKDAFTWSVGAGLMRQSDTYVLTSDENMVARLSSHFGTKVQHNMQIIKTPNHFYIKCDGHEFNSAGIGYR